MSKARPIGRAFSRLNKQRIRMSKSVKGSVLAGMIGLAFVFATPFVRKYAEQLAARDVPLWKKDNGDPIIDISANVESMKTTWASMRAAIEKGKPEDSVIEEDQSTDKSVEKIYLVIPDEDDKITGTDNK